MHDGTIATIKLLIYNKHDANNNQTTISYEELQMLWGEKTPWKITTLYLVVWASKKVLLIHMSMWNKFFSKCGNILLVGK
jgi:hypothetical protein